MIPRIEHIDELPEGVKATTGGKFDRNEPMPYFIATGAAALVKVDYPNVLVAVNEIKSKKDYDDLDYLCENRKVMLDSGIFNLAMNHVREHGVSHNEALSMPPDQIDGFNELWDRYGEVATRYADRLWGVVELDQGGVENKPITRKRIEDEFGITPIPVYHPLLDGWDYYDDLAKEYDRICFGNIVQAAPPLRLRLAHTASERSKDYPYLWTHLLGMTPNENTFSLPMRGSMDSSSWLTAVRWYPSWYAKAMLKRAGNYPPAMWPSENGSNVEETHTEDGKPRSMEVVKVNLRAMKETMETVREDTALWLK